MKIGEKQGYEETVDLLGGQRGSNVGEVAMVVVVVVVVFVAEKEERVPGKPG
ncbi:hypothetical protein K0M31_007393 [Melipona bicolor]|uniref:Uncharacterized protein n=1 Tax=Melipona bicolor TaxID=60889 RepID=A0AA40KVP0_9HYME|nr:hypothetical protein K0M31_007393 [Melipona bicolor]